MWVKLISLSIFTFIVFASVEKAIPASSANDPKVRTAGSPMSTTNFSPYVDHEGNISFPHGFEKEWQHLGSWSVTDENGKNSTLHNVYSPAYVAREYRKIGQFPDGAPILKEVLNTSNSIHTTGDAHWASDVIVRFLMIKDQRGRFEGNDLWGDGWGWALFEKQNTSSQVATNYKDDCLGCHVPVKESDWVYVYGYPALGKEVSEFFPAALSNDSVISSEMDLTKTKASDATLKLGEKVFKRCIACHSLTPGKHKIGPSLADVGNRKAAFWPDYNYSNVMKESGIIWSRENLNNHLKDVKGFIKGNKMGTLFPLGVQNDVERDAVITYLMDGQ